MKLSLPAKIIIGSVTLSLMGAVSVFAMPQQANVHASTTDPGSQAGTHLADAKLKACQNRQKAINNIMTRIVTRGNNQITVFDTIATRTEAFYQKQGKTLANYNDLVTAVTTAKTKAETDLAAMKTTDTLDCTSSNPKGIVSAFQDSLKLEIADLKAYRTAVKNLIVGVKSVQGTTSSTDSKQGGQQ